MSAGITQSPIELRVRYVFGLLRHDGERDERTLSIEPGQTVLDVLRQLDLSGIELLTVVNNEMVGDHTILCDGDELTLIPAIQGG